MKRGLLTVVLALSVLGLFGCGPSLDEKGMPVDGKRLDVIYQPPHEVSSGPWNVAVMQLTPRTKVDGSWTIRDGNVLYIEGLGERVKGGGGNDVLETVSIRQAKLFDGIIYILWDDGKVDKVKHYRTVRVER